MAEDEAEKAFLQAQTLNTDEFPMADPSAGVSDSENYDPSMTLQDQSSTPLADSNRIQNETNDSSVVNESSGQTFTENAPAPAESAEKGSPQSASPPHPAGTESQDPTPVSASNVPKTKTIGGFVVDDEDEEENDKDDAEYEPPGVVGGVRDMGQVSSNVSERPVSDENANESVSTSGVSIQQHPVPETANSNVSNNASFSHSTSTPVQTGQNVYTPQVQQSGEHTDSSAPTPKPSTPAVMPSSKGRLPHDRVGILEDRIKDDPRGDVDAWLELIAEHRSRNRIDNARDVYERFFKVFPSCAEQWVAYINMESEMNELYRLEQIFNRTLLHLPNVQLWTVYLDYVRRRNPLTTDTTGQARRVITSAYDLALQHVGMDKDAGTLWTDYVQFIKSGPGNVGGSSWQDQQKMDLLRKAYQRAICIPTHALNTLWKEYDQFEMGLNKLTGRKFLQERSPAYMTARSCFTELQNITRDLDRTTLPRLPPIAGSDGDVEFVRQVDIWRRWIEWEKGDPLVLKDEDPSAYKNRVVYVYKQALMALRFVPEVWYDAAEFCFQNGLESEGNDFLKQGIDANPESCLLAFKLADRTEISTESEQDPKRRGSKVREVYDRLLDALYELMAKARAREAQDVARIEENYAQSQTIAPDEDDEERASEAKAKEAAKKSQIEAIRQAHSIQINMLSKTISFAWIALMRAMRRIQGKGKPGELAGFRQVFADARKRGRITSDVYIASALMEYHCYKDPAATKIFERGAKLFPDDENFALEYLKHLIDINDVTNARAVFEMTVRRLASNPENVHKAKPIFMFMHEYESRYGDLTQVINLESRMRELFPDDPALSHFSHRYSTPSFDPTAVRPIISPTQARPKSTAAVEQQASAQGTPIRYLDTSLTQSPKRPFPTDDFDDPNRPRKFVRAESPLKTVAARRPDQQKRLQPSNGSSGQYSRPPSSEPLPRDIINLLSIIPPASTYNATRFSPEKLVDLIRRIDIPSSISQIRPPVPTMHGFGTGSQPYSGGF